MRLLAKFNIILIAAFALGLVAVCAVTNLQLRSNAQTQVLSNARILVDTALAMRGYTNDQVGPLLASQDAHHFLPQSIPFYAATQVFNGMRGANPQYAAYTYKEATLDPTNPRDRATDWEADIVNQFRNNSEQTEIEGQRSTPTGESLYLAHPIRVGEQACLTCHSTPSVAPASMVKEYGSDNGFNWHLNDVVGAQIVSVPMTLPETMAHRAFYSLIGSLVAVFLATLIVVNLMLTFLVIRPVTRLSKVADNISTGNLTEEEIAASGKDEISTLARSFNRMQRSLRTAMSMLDSE